MDSKVLIMEATLDEFSKRGLKFTMDDIAQKLHMSKKTIYTFFTTKEDLFISTVNYGFDQIKIAEQKILNDPNLATLEKIEKILIVLPERYQHVDWRNIYLCKNKFPSIYEQIKRRLESDWDGTIMLLETAISEGVIRPISIPVLKTMLNASFEHFINSTNLIEHDIPYNTALSELISILMHGIVQS